MAFTKVEALALVTAAGGTTKAELGDEQRGEVLQFIVENSQISKYGSAIPVQEVNQGSITLTKAIDGTIEEKTGIGAGTGKVAAVSQVTVELDKVEKIHETFSDADLISGFENAYAVKLVKQADQMKKHRERKAFETVEALGTPVALTSDIEATYDTLVAAAAELTKLVDASQGIDMISRDHIFIDLDPTLAAKLIKLEFASNEGAQAFANGMYEIVNLGGFKAFINPYLITAQAIVSTTFAGIAPFRIVAANAGRFDISNDKAVYTEWKRNKEGFKEVFSGVTKVFTAPAGP